MRSGTSYFNRTLYRKNLARFWPIWALYTVVWVFLVPMQFFSLSMEGVLPTQHSEFYATQAQRVVNTLSSGVALSVCVGLAAAMAVFSYLCFGRSACMMHALPMDRKGLFFTSYLSGLTFLWAPHVVVFLVTLAVEVFYSCLNMEALVMWLLVQSGTSLYFYSFAVFCAMFTGNILALPAFYGILNFLVYVISFLFNEILDAFYYGYTGMGAAAENVIYWFTPAAKMMESCQIANRVIYEQDNAVTMERFAGELDHPGAIAVYAVVAVGFTLVALGVYHRRQVESAGDVVAIPIVRPLFKYGVAVCAGLCCGILNASILGQYDAERVLSVLVVLWTVVGYFAAEMLLKKSFRVLRAWKGALAAALAMVLVFVGIYMDWLGYESRVPMADDVASVTVRLPMGAPYDSAQYANNLTITDPEKIQKIIALHRAIVAEEGRAGGNGYTELRLTYTLKEGGSFSRRYWSVPVYIDEQELVGSVTRCAGAIVNDRALVAQAYGFETFEQEWRLVQAYVDQVREYDEKYYSGDVRYADGYVYLKGDPAPLWEAMKADFAEGTIGVRYLFSDQELRTKNTYTSDLNFVFQRDRLDEWGNYLLNSNGQRITTSSELSITLTPQARRTLACLEELGVSADSFRTYCQVELEDDQTHTYYD